MKNIITFILISSILIFTVSKIYQLIKPSYWQGFYYPNGNMFIDYASPVFRTKKQCLDWALTIKQERKNPNDDYECGKNCVREEDRIISLCDETVDY